MNVGVIHKEDAAIKNKLVSYGERSSSSCFFLNSYGSAEGKEYPPHHVNLTIIFQTELKVDKSNSQMNWNK